MRVALLTVATTNAFAFLSPGKCRLCITTAVVYPCPCASKPIEKGSKLGHFSCEYREMHSNPLAKQFHLSTRRPGHPFNLGVSCVETARILTLLTLQRLSAH